MEPTDLTWRKATKSSNGGASCVELADQDGTVFVRDSKRPHDGHLVVTAATFGELLTSVKRGELDIRLGVPHTTG